MITSPPGNPPGLCVSLLCTDSDSESAALETVRSVSNILSGKHWSLCATIFGHGSDIGGALKREMVTANRVSIRQVDHLQTRSHMIADSLRPAWMLHHELPLATVLRPGQLMLPGFLQFAEWAGRSGHTLSFSTHLSGHSVFGPDDPEAAAPNAFIVRSRDVGAGIFDLERGSSEDFWHGTLDRLADIHSMPITCWHGSTPIRDSLNRGRDGFWEDLRMGTARTSRQLKPGAYAFLAIGKQSIEELQTAVASLRLCGTPATQRVVVATDDPEAVRAMFQHDPFVDVWPAHPFQSDASIATENWELSNWLYGLARAVAMKPSFAREAHSVYGSCLLCDTDIVFVRDTWALPGVPASTPKTFPWYASGGYSSCHQWGLNSAGLLWFPPGCGAFIEEFAVATLANVRQMRSPGRSRSSMPGGSGFLEQDGFDAAAHALPFAPLDWGNNVTPSCLGVSQSAFVSEPIVPKTHRAYLVYLADQAQNMLGFRVCDGVIWYNGMPVRSFHCHLNGRQRWNQVFEDVIYALMAKGDRTWKIMMEALPPWDGKRSPQAAGSTSTRPCTSQSKAGTCRS